MILEWEDRYIKEMGAFVLGATGTSRTFVAAKLRAEIGWTLSSKPYTDRKSQADRIGGVYPDAENACLRAQQEEDKDVAKEKK